MRALSLLLLLVISSKVWAAPSCNAYLKEQKIITPVARITFSADGNKKNSMTLSKNETLLNASFTKSFLTGLTSYFAGKSTTTSRLEERSVMKEEDSAKLLEDSGLKWEARDIKKEGEDFTTITTYSGKFIMDSQGDVDISAKLRARKYFSHDIGEAQTSNMTSVFGDAGSLEIKISNVAGVDSDGFKAFPASVFKPRIFISDAGLKKLSSLSVKKLKNEETKQALIDELFALEINGKKSNFDKYADDGGRLKVEEFITAITLLLEKNPNLFEVQTVVAYNRDSYSAKLENGTEYQYTLDRNIRIYEPNNKLLPSERVKYLEGKPLHKVEDGVAFAELKSPMMEKTENTEAYQKLSYALFSRHKVTFKNGKGKHSLGANVRKRLNQTTLSEQLYTEGLYYYLIKGIGNSPNLPNRKKLVEMGEWNIGLPLKIDGEDHRLVLGYTANPKDGQTTEVLSSIGLVDSLGKRVDLDKNGVKDIISNALKSKDPSTITIDNQALSFPSVIDAETTAKVTDFFSKFYTNHSKRQANPREINSLHPVDNLVQLNSYRRRMNLSNTLSYLKDRSSKVVAGAMIIGAVSLGPKMMDKLHVFNRESTVEAVFSNRIEDNLGINIVTPEGNNQITVQMNRSGGLDVLPITPSTPETPDINMDISAIKEIDFSDLDSDTPPRIILNK